MKYRNISRIDSSRVHGWRVRFDRAGGNVSKLFSDRKYGHMSRALEAAVACRDKLQEQVRTSIQGLGSKGISWTPSGNLVAKVNTGSKVLWRTFRKKNTPAYLLIERAVNWQRRALRESLAG